MSTSLLTASSPNRAYRPNLAARLLLITSGALWGLWYFGMNRLGWGEPGTYAYSRYEAYNRAAPLVLLLLLAATQSANRLLMGGHGLAGRIGSHVASAGLGVMALGSALEFWVFTGTSYAPGSLRGVGWSTYCLGLLLFYLGTAALGFGLRRVRGLGVAGVLLMCWLPVGAALGGVGSLIGVGLPSLSTAVALCGAAYVVLGWRLNSPRR